MDLYLVSRWIVYMNSFLLCECTKHWFSSFIYINIYIYIYLYQHINRLFIQTSRGRGTGFVTHGRVCVL